MNPNKAEYCSFSSAEFLAECQDEKLLDDEKLTEQNFALNSALSQIAIEFGKDSMLSMQRFYGSRYAPTVPTGSLKLDHALGIGGLPKGRIVEIYGKEASGKTTLGLHIIKEAQKLGGYCAYLNVENALDQSFAESIGVDTDNLLVVRPNSAENLFSITDTLSRSGSIAVIVVDSVAALLPKCELDDPTIGNCIEVQSHLMIQALRKIQFSLPESQTLVVFINQIRSRPHRDFGFTAEEITSGGFALKFYAAVRVRLSRTGLLINDDNEVDGISFSAEIMKNKLTSAPKKKVELELRFGRGIPCEADVLEMACKHGLIDRVGNGSYRIGGEYFQNKQETENYLAENDEVRDNLIKELRTQMFEAEFLCR
ncbi:hypothetical protein GIB67_019891 [Kingdonia uniflora]|uniref:Uncharacterized protein n=1 Tax=Kingdonia uniflora TaxID=39325 RepID=A0A7J7MKB7_9MAGN|nr:hypothetical protein GIB67_019891 [Kingdonia uniflora]